MFQSEHEKPPCGLQVQCESAQNDHAATLELRNNQIGWMCNKALLCDSDRLDT